jgi:methylenetetrahydrofolate dehydrogenase (NADP+)/methenyltetrahydrofolate cyclohydrolase
VTQARLLYGGPIAAGIRSQVKRGVADFSRRHSFRPVLAAVKVGNKRASSVYVSQILRTSEAVGVPTRVIDLPASTSPAELTHELQRLNEDETVAGVIVQQPLPRAIPLSTVTDTILPAKGH